MTQSIVTEELLPCPFCSERLEQTGEIVKFWNHPARSIEEARCPGSAVSIENSPDFDADAFARWNRRASKPADGWKTIDSATHRHKKRGSEYVLIGIGKMQAAGFVLPGGTCLDHPFDMAEVAIYRSIDDGSLWVRPREEFEDGRFEVLPPSSIPGDKK